MKWFKFYGQDFLTDPKIKSLSVEMRQCWVVLLCMANGEDKNGKIKYVNEVEVMRLAGIEEDGQTWHETIGFLEVFEKLEMITIDNVINNLYNITLINYQNRQGEAKTAYERVKEYRERKKHQKLDDNGATLSKRNKSLQNVIKNEANDNDDNENDNARLDKIREDKILNTGDKRPEISETPQNGKPTSVGNILSSRIQRTQNSVPSKQTGISTSWQEKGFRYAQQLGIKLNDDIKPRWLKVFKQAAEGRKPANLERAYSYLSDLPEKEAMDKGELINYFFWIYENGLTGKFFQRKL